MRFTGVPTSERTAEQARSLGIPLATLADIKEIDLTIDGADEVQLGTLALIKGHGGALLREKIVASASKRMAVIVDETKLVKRLGGTLAVPVEVVPFGWGATARKLRAIGAGPELRPGVDDKPYITDGGHYILDCAFGPIADPKKIARELDETVGVVEHGAVDRAGDAVVHGRRDLRRDGTVGGQVAVAKATVDQEAKDVSAFLAWAAEPHQEERKHIGFSVMIYLVLFAGLLYASYRRIWRNIAH